MSITNKLNQIKNAIYGKEVRGAIHDAIKQVYDDASVNHNNANMEVKMARGTHNTLNDRLDNVDEIQAQTNVQLSGLDNIKLNREEQNSISMGMLTQEVKKNMTNGKVAVVGVDSVGYVQLTQDIQNDITEIVNISSPYNNCSADISDNKVIITSSVWYRHQIFNVSEGERYEVTVDTLNNTSIKYCIFSNDDLDVVGYSITGIDSSQKITKNIVVPSGASKMYINTKSDGVINVKKYTYSKIATKNELKRVESATNEVNNKISRAENEINKINNELKELKELVILPYENQDKGYDNINGVAQKNNSPYYKSIICDCSELDSVYVNFKTLDNVNVYYIHFITDDFKVISSLCNNYEQLTIVKDLELKVPVGATKVIVNTSKDYDCSCKKDVFKSIPTKDELNNFALKSDMFIFREMIIPYVQGERYIIENGKAVKDLSDTAQWYTATIIDVKETEKYYVTLTWTYSSYSAVIFTDADNNVLSTSLSGTGSTVTYRDVELIVPTGAVKMIVQNENNIIPPIVKKYAFKYENSKELTIPPYSANYLEQKISIINDYEYKIGSDGDSFIFVTDIHIDDNRLISASLIDEIVSKTNIKKVIFGGDLIKNSPSSEKEIIEFCRLFKEKYGHHQLYSVMGNHDLLGYSSDTHLAQYVQSDSMRYGLLGKMQEDYCTFGSNKGFYYYFDNKNQKIRYICLNLFENTESNRGSIYVSNEQIQWLKSEAISGLTSEWEIVIVSHTGLTLETFPGANNNYIKKVKTAVDEINDTYNVICCLSGHMHKDLNEFNSNTMHISFACDAPYPDDGIQRTRGTNNEYCFDVVCIDKTNRKINCVRIGAGDDREFNY